MTNFIIGYKVKCNNNDFKNMILTNELVKTFFSNRTDMIFIIKTISFNENDVVKLNLELNRLGDWKDTHELSEWLVWMSELIEFMCINKK